MRIERDTAKLIAGHFTEIRKAIATAQKQIDKIIDKSVKLNANNHALYNEQTLAVKTAELRQKAGEEAAQVKSTAIQRTRESFANISISLREWIMQPVPASFAAVLDIVKSYNVQLERAELEILAESGTGNYLASRILSDVGEQFGIRIDFLPYRELERQLAAAQNDVKTAINAYVGSLSTVDHHFIALDLGLPIAPEGTDLWHVFPQDYADPERDTSLSRIERVLTDMTQSNFSILPTKKAEIDKIFGDADDEKRVRIAAALIDRSDPIAALLPLYDQQLYNEGCKRLDEALRERVLSTMAAKADLDADTQAVISELVKAETRRAADKQREQAAH